MSTTQGSGATHAEHKAVERVTERLVKDGMPEAQARQMAAESGERTARRREREGRR